MSNRTIIIFSKIIRHHRPPVLVPTTHNNNQALKTAFTQTRRLHNFWNSNRLVPIGGSTGSLPSSAPSPYDINTRRVAHYRIMSSSSATQTTASSGKTKIDDKGGGTGIGTENDVPEGMQLIEEGSVRMLYPKGRTVFYNPVLFIFYISSQLNLISLLFFFTLFLKDL